MVSALLIGLAATAVVAAAHLLDADRRAELMALDFRFRHVSTAPPSGEIVVVHIDDHSLAKLGEWPWPREVLAGIVNVLGECGARAVALDIIMPEPQKTRFYAAEADIYDPDTAPVIGTPAPRAVFDDALFETAVRGGRVLLPMHMGFGRQEAPGTPVDAAVRELMRAEPEIDFASVVKRVLPNLAPGIRTPRIEEAAKAYWRMHACRALQRFTIPPDRIADYPARTGAIVPPLVRFATACHGSGFVTFRPDIDSVMRRIPLLARSDSRAYPQFAFSLAAEHLARGGQPTVRATADHVTVEAPGGRRRDIPVDGDGDLLINWRTGPDAFGRIPAASVAFVWQLRQRIERNRRHSRMLSLALARRLGQGDLLALFKQVDELYHKRTAAEIARQRAALYDPANVPAPPADLLAAEEQAERKIDELTGELLGNLDFLVGGVAKDDPARRAVEDLAGRIGELRRENERRGRELGEELADVRRRVEGRVCLVGSTATGAADFVPTPIEVRMPGVVVHANIFSTIVSGAFVTEAPAAANVGAILLAGALMSLLAAKLPVFRAGVAAVLLAGAFAAGNIVAFVALNCWLVLIAPLGAIVAALLAVTAYREATEERAKRHIRGLFAHALSPALVDRLIEDPSLARLGGERRVLSCFFSDLKSFTALSEHLGEQDTVRLLNRYFDRMTEVIQVRYGGYLNKFLGDGILGFFGAPVVQEDHARRALAAALACQEEVALLNESLADELGQAVTLACRIGISTGPVIVGNCGSTQRMDYTAIGDCVNLASRLESANKQFGTGVLVDDRAWRQGDDGSLLARTIGKVLVVGKTEPVRVWHVVGPAEDAGEDLREALGEFARGVERFERQEFAEAARVFESVIERLDGDGPAELLLSVCRQHLASPPGQEWDGAIQLTEK